MSAYISEFSYSNTGTPSFVEIAVPAGTDISGYTLVVYKANGHVDATYSFGTVDSTVTGQDIYTVQNEPTGSFPVVGTDVFALVDNHGNVVQFIGQSSVTATQGPAAGMTSTDVGQAPGSTSLQSDDGGATYYQQTEENPGTIPCYAPGSLIGTPDGPRAVETLLPGDQVLTRDNGFQSVRWIRRDDQSLEGERDDSKPVLIKANALGRNLPNQDLVVSPQHRILVGGGRQLQHIFGNEVFAPAKALTCLPGIRHMRGKSQITWVHFACDRHEVVTANGCLSESLLLGAMVLNRLTLSERAALNDIFASTRLFDAPLNGVPARECLSVNSARRLIARHRNADTADLFSKIRQRNCARAMGTYESDRFRRASTVSGPHA